MIAITEDIVAESTEITAVLVASTAINHTRHHISGSNYQMIKRIVLSFPVGF